MTESIPTPVTNAIINSFSGLVVGGKRKIDEWHLRRLRRDIDALAKVSRHQAEVLSGMLAVYENDEEQLRTRFSNALKLRPDDAWVLGRYSKALRTYGLIFDALDYSRRSIWITPSVEAMRDYVELVAITLDFEDADSLHILVSEAHPESRTPIQSMWDHLERLRAVVRKSALDLTEAKRCTDMLWKHFRNQEWIVGCGKPVVLTEEQEIHHSLTLPGAGAEEIAEINFLIANALVEIGASDNFLRTIIYGATGSKPTGAGW